MQPGLPTIQGVLEEIVSEIEGKPVHVAGSGRTDAGVHALEQVAAFSLENPIPLPNLRRAINRLLPPAIRVLDGRRGAPPISIRASTPWPRPTNTASFATKSVARSSGRTSSIILTPWTRSAWPHSPACFEGEHDFTAFAASDDRDAEGRSKVRTVFSSVLERSEGRLTYRVRGSGFLKHMVRNIVGTLIEAGRGNLCSVTELPERCGATAPARGLFLLGVEYPAVECPMDDPGDRA